MSLERLTAALEAADRGWEVFPVEVRFLSGGKSEKIPKVRWGSEATTDAEVIRRWWLAWPDAYVGIATGKRSNLYVIDVDAVEVSEDGELGKGVRIPTQRQGGFHYYFSGPTDSKDIRNSAEAGVDVRGDGGFVVMWESWTPSAELLPMPEEITQWARSRSRRDESIPNSEEFGVIHWPGGGSDQWVARMVGHMRRAGWRPEAALNALIAENDYGRFEPRCDVDWLAEKVVGIYQRYEKGVEVQEKLLQSLSTT